MQTERMAPVSTDQRIEVLDILRGFALLGILIVNMAFYSFPIIAEFTGTPRGTGTLDYAADFVITWLATAKFYPMFSFLFGLGMSIQMARFQDRGKDLLRFMIRRMLILMAFGFAHAVFIWNVDILFIYGMLGILALAFRNVKPRTLLITAAAFGMIPGVLILLATAATPGADVETGVAPLIDLEQRTIETYRNGTFAQIFVWRAVEWLAVLFINLVLAGLQIEALFLFGLYCGKRGIFQNGGQHRRLFDNGMRFGLGIGLPMNFIAAWMSGDVHSPWAAVGSILTLAFGPVLTCGYISTVVILSQSPWSLERLSPLAAAGRMALTNYLTQSIVCTFVFYSYGLGLYGEVGAAAGAILSIAIWVIQMRVSVAWLREFQFGPMEWLWRSLNYGKIQWMRKSYFLIET